MQPIKIDTMTSVDKIRIAILASGSGSNAEKIIQYFKSHAQISVELVATNNPKAGVIPRAKNLGHEIHIFDPILEEEKMLDLLRSKKIAFIILAGYLKKIPQSWIETYPDKIINIHPALLPQYGGKGMYGCHIHTKVYQNKEKYSGITIHLVNEKYDEGQHLFQLATRVDQCDSAEAIAQKVLTLEHYYYPRVIEFYLNPTMDFLP